MFLRNSQDQFCRDVRRHEVSEINFGDDLGIQGDVGDADIIFVSWLEIHSANANLEGAFSCLCSNRSQSSHSQSSSVQTSFRRSHKAFTGPDWFMV